MTTTGAYDTIEIDGQQMKLAHALKSGLVRLGIERGNSCDRDIRLTRSIPVAYAVHGKGKWVVSRLFYKAHTRR